MEKSIVQLHPCRFCSGDVSVKYFENKNYKYTCNNCGQYLIFNSESQLKADEIYNHFALSDDSSYKWDKCHVCGQTFLKSNDNSCCSFEKIGMYKFK